MNDTTTYRAVCLKCRKAESACYCSQLRPFAAGPRFVVLIHPKENRKRIGTGRMTHLAISNSELIEGVSFTDNEKVSRILADPSLWPVVLYPGRDALDLTQDAPSKLETAVPAGKTLVIFVLDGTWFCAKKMLRVSANLKKLPQIRFLPPHLSNYQIRRQPGEICFSTVEAVHFLIESLRDSTRWQSDAGYGNLLEVFRYMVDQQLSHATEAGRRAIRGDRSAAN